MGKEIALTKSGNAMVLYSEQENTAVVRSVGQLKEDIGKVSGCTDVTVAAICGEDAQHGYIEGQNNVDLCIVAGTIGKNTIIDSRISQGVLNMDAILAPDGSYRWEGYVIQEFGGILYIAGSDRRGTIYGVYEFSRWMGVSPWYYFGDVPVKKRELHIPAGFYRADYPSVQYRGIFINDEEELEAWAKKHTSDRTIGPLLYERIFELLLRLKANYIWPAMHVNYFNENPRNGELAEEMGIVVGTSHCDMLLRSNQNEWKPWVEKNGYHDLEYDYSIEGQNREKLKEYWRESLEMNRDYENTYTIGMRGIHDYGFVTRKIEENTDFSEEQKLREKIRLMQKIFSDQRDIMEEVLGRERAESAVRVFIPYKEVLDLYDGGLEVPEDVTLMWVDDNFGHMRRYPDAAEAARKGGCGLYYHSSYWAHPEMSYLFINSIPLAQTGIELEKSYRKGIRKIWVLNAGAIKPLEMDIEYFIQYGWEAGKSEALTGHPDRDECGTEKGGVLTRNPERFVQEWIDFNFSGGFGREAADLYQKYAQITNVRKVEHMVSEVFMQEGYGDEAGRRLVCLKELYDRGNEMMLSLPKNERHAFFELFLMKIHASFWINAEYYFADRSRLSFRRGLGRAADRYIEYSRMMMDGRRKMLHFYNKIMCGGKWDAILTPEAFPPPGLPLYPAGKPALVIGKNPCLSVVTWDGVQVRESGELVFYSSGLQRKWIEIGNLGGGQLAYEICGHADTWLTLSHADGVVQAEQRIYLSVSEDCGDRADEIVLEISAKNTGEKKLLCVRRIHDTGMPDGYSGFAEADGGVSIIANRFEWAENIKIVPGLGRMCGNAVMAVPPEGEKATLEYVFYTFSEGDYGMEIQRYVTLDSKGRIRMEVTLDSCPSVLLESKITDEWRGEWKDSILNNGEKLYCTWRGQKKGMHTLTITMLDEFVTIDRITIYTEAKKANNLGIPCRIEQRICPEDYPELNPEQMMQQAEELYRVGQKDIPLPNQVYAGKDFWKIERLYAHNEEYAQEGRGKKRNYKQTGMGRKDVRKEMGKVCFLEKNGRLGIEAECVLAENENAWRSSAQDGRCKWEHLQAETAGRTGLAMMAEPVGIFYEKPSDAPGLHYKIRMQEQGNYHVWLLMYVADARSDLLVLALDGDVQPLEEQYSHGGQFTYGTSHIYYWNLLSDLELTEGEHTLSIFPLKTGFRIDRIYLTRGDELPPEDARWDEVIE